MESQQTSHQCTTQLHLIKPRLVQGKEDILSNFWNLDTPIRDDGIIFHTIEHLYQYRKCVEFGQRDVAIALAHMVEPHEAKSYADKYVPETVSAEW